MAKRKTIDLPFEKPPFKIPTMVEIKKIKPNGLTVASLFCGCGGSSLGYRMAGYKILYAVDFHKHAVKQYKLNAADYTIVEERDITKMDGEELQLQMFINGGELDVLDGSPPCQTFSTSNTMQSTSEKLNDEKSDLFMDFARILKQIQPRTFIAENVSGMIRGAAKGAFKKILQALIDCGYQVECRLLDSQWLGVAQARRRVIFVGVRNDLKMDPVHPSPLPYNYSIKEALPEIAKAIKDNGGKFPMEPRDKNVKTKTDRIQALLRPGETHHKHFSYQRAHPDRPAPCIIKATKAVHPFENRLFTVRELKRLCSYPDDFKMDGSNSQQTQRLGNSVPPLMMRAIAETLRDKVLKP